MINVHDADGTSWFNKEAFEGAVAALGLANATELNVAAEKSGYRLDDLSKLLVEPPSWTSTRKPRPVPRGGRSANKRDQSMPPRPSSKASAKKAAPAKPNVAAKPKKSTTK